MDRAVKWTLARVGRGPAAATAQEGGMRNAGQRTPGVAGAPIAAAARLAAVSREHPCAISRQEKSVAREAAVAPPIRLGPRKAAEYARPPAAAQGGTLTLCMHFAMLGRGWRMGRTGKRHPLQVHVGHATYRRLRVLADRRGQSLSRLVEETLVDRLAAEHVEDPLDGSAGVGPSGCSRGPGSDGPAAGQKRP